MQYLVVIEQGPNSFGAYVPDLPGCIAAGDTHEEVATLIQEAIELHIEDLKAQGLQVPLRTQAAGSCTLTLNVQGQFARSIPTQAIPAHCSWR